MLSHHLRHCPDLNMMGPKINDSKDPFARYPDLQEEKAIIHDKKESSLYGVKKSTSHATRHEINLEIDVSEPRHRRRWRGAPEI